MKIHRLYCSIATKMKRDAGGHARDEARCNATADAHTFIFRAAQTRRGQLTVDVSPRYLRAGKHAHSPFRLAAQGRSRNGHAPRPYTPNARYRAVSKAPASHFRLLNTTHTRRAGMPHAGRDDARCFCRLRRRDGHYTGRTPRKPRLRRTPYQLHAATGHTFGTLSMLTRRTELTAVADK